MLCHGQFARIDFCAIICGWRPRSYRRSICACDPRKSRLRLAYNYAINIATATDLQYDRFITRLILLRFSMHKPRSCGHILYRSRGATNRIFLGKVFFHEGTRLGCVPDSNVMFTTIKTVTLTCLPSHSTVNRYLLAWASSDTASDVLGSSELSSFSCSQNA